MDQSSEYGPHAPIGCDDGDSPSSLCITLNQDDLASVGLDANAELGDLMHAAVIGEVTNIHKFAGENGEACVSIRVQLISMGLHNGDHEDIETQPITDRMTSALYG